MQLLDEMISIFMIHGNPRNNRFKLVHLHNVMTKYFFLHCATDFFLIAWSISHLHPTKARVWFEAWASIVAIHGLLFEMIVTRFEREQISKDTVFISKIRRITYEKLPSFQNLTSANNFDVDKSIFKQFAIAFEYNYFV